LVIPSKTQPSAKSYYSVKNGGLKAPAAAIPNQNRNVAGLIVVVEGSAAALNNSLILRLMKHPMV
jgi:hypothetical protein